jgi:hypothetical protein
VSAADEREGLFDRVEVRHPDGTTEHLDRRQFAALPINRRVRILLQADLWFFRGSERVPTREAVKSL